MVAQQGPHPDAARSRLRGLVAKVSLEIERLSEPVNADGKKNKSGLNDAWVALVKQLDLGPEPKVRDCPHCGHICMHAATVCAYCWNKLPEIS
jgi:hypothetical protein